MIQITIGLTTEGSTDIRFLMNIIKRTFDEIAFDCKKDIEILDIVTIKEKKDTFTDSMLCSALTGVEKYSITMLCIHSDADCESNKVVLQRKFEPFLQALSEKSDKDYCKVVIPIIPVRMMESWMLADKALFKSMINAKKETEQELGIEKNPESYSDPKEIIKRALRIAQKNVSRRRYQMTIDDLYEEVGRDIELDSLRKLTSFRHFEQGVRFAFKQMNYL